MVTTENFLLPKSHTLVSSYTITLCHIRPSKSSILHAWFEIGKTLSLVTTENLLLPTSHTLVSAYPRGNQLQCCTLSTVSVTIILAFFLSDNLHRSTFKFHFLFSALLFINFNFSARFVPSSSEESSEESSEDSDMFPPHKHELRVFVPLLLPGPPLLIVLISLWWKARVRIIVFGTSASLLLFISTNFLRRVSLQ
jgi:hypothetical protein